MSFSLTRWRTSGAGAVSRQDADTAPATILKGDYTDRQHTSKMLALWSVPSVMDGIIMVAQSVRLVTPSGEVNHVRVI